MEQDVDEETYNLLDHSLVLLRAAAHQPDWDAGEWCGPAVDILGRTVAFVDTPEGLSEAAARLFVRDCALAAACSQLDRLGSASPMSLVCRDVLRQIFSYFAPFSHRRVAPSIRFSVGIEFAANEGAPAVPSVLSIATPDCVCALDALALSGDERFEALVRRVLCDDSYDTVLYGCGGLDATLAALCGAGAPAVRRVLDAQLAVFLERTPEILGDNPGQVFSRVVRRGFHSRQSMLLPSLRTAVAQSHVLEGDQIEAFYKRLMERDCHESPSADFWRQRPLCKAAVECCANSAVLALLVLGELRVDCDRVRELSLRVLRQPKLNCIFPLQVLLQQQRHRTQTCCHCRRPLPEFVFSRKQLREVPQEKRKCLMCQLKAKIETVQRDSRERDEDD
jgi:hypothetical protein